MFCQLLSALFLILDADRVACVFCGQVGVLAWPVTDACTSQCAKIHAGVLCCVVPSSDIIAITLALSCRQLSSGGDVRQQCE